MGRRDRVGSRRAVAEVEGWLASMATAGYEIDEHGRLVTLRSPAYRLRLCGNDPTSNPGLVARSVAPRGRWS
jgi:hypothetical protein